MNGGSPEMLLYEVDEELEVLAGAEDGPGKLRVSAALALVYGRVVLYQAPAGGIPARDEHGDPKPSDSNIHSDCQ